jgi:hypothetical protein
LLRESTDYRLKSLSWIPRKKKCHYRESTPERPSEALPFKTRSFLTETLSQYLFWKPTIPVILLPLSTILPLTGMMEKRHSNSTPTLHTSLIFGRRRCCRTPRIS